jgi:hypothetical protein
VPFTGTGWVYLGEEGGQKGLNYLRRRASDEGQVFMFKPETAGVYRLNFNRQDLIRGTSWDEAVEVAVLLKSQVLPLPADTAIHGHGVNDIESADGLQDSAADTPPVVETLAAARNADDLLWNRGQELEAPGQSRDMKAALELYRNLVRDYPESEHYTDSQKRIAYIERFFVNIR